MKFFMFSLVLPFLVPFAAESFAGEDPAIKWENDINYFMELDSKNYYPKSPILFVGSSSIRMWKTFECFPDLPVINRGFGGSQVSDLLYYYDKLILKYKPNIIVLYSGDNDIAVGKTPKRTSNDYKKFFQLTRKNLPNTPIVVLSTKACNARWNFWPNMQATNCMVEEIAKKDDMIYYLDVSSALLGENNIPDDSYFLSDRLHLNDKGYKVWTSLVRKVIDEILAKNKD